MRARRLVAWTVGSGMLLGVAVGCGPAPQDRAQRVPDDEVPFDLLDPSAPTVVPPDDTVTRSLCLVAEDELVPVDRALPSETGLVDVVRSLGDEPTEVEVASGLRTAITDPDTILDVEATGGTASVDLSDKSPVASSSDAVLAIGQVVCTLTAQPGIGQVRFTVEGVEVEVPRADGSLADSAVTRDDYASLIAPVG